MPAEDAAEKIEWQVSVPIFKDAVILKQLGIALGIPFSIVAIVIGLTSGASVYTLYALGLIGALLLLTWLFVMAVYGGKYEAEFMLDDQGALCSTQAGQRKKNRVVNALAVGLGLLTGKPAVAGAGMMAQARQEVALSWSCVSRVAYKPRNHTILLRGGWTERLALFCTSENYPAVEQAVRNRTRHLQDG